MKADNCVFAARLVLVSALAVALPALADQETRDLSGFDSIEIGGGIDLVVRQGQGFQVEVESDDGELDEIITEIRGKTLVIRRERSTGSFFDWGGDSGEVTVRLPSLVALQASGGSDVETEGSISGERLEIVASGGSDVTLDLAVGDLQVKASGGSDVNLRGTARSLVAQSSGGSDLDARGLMAEAADVSSSGGSDLSIAVRDSLVANASGGSDISYTGDPRSKDINSSGGADIRQR